MIAESLIRIAVVAAELESQGAHLLGVHSSFNGPTTLQVDADVLRRLVPDCAETGHGDWLHLHATYRGVELIAAELRSRPAAKAGSLLTPTTCS